ncbi:AMIN domain-containing protein [Hydrogenimonas thermophila]|uniref:AMIN domain-containing protein n=1 Tax=Hydrogenimonas thermophila TaxID=223786 RepID=A0A1I5L5T5_9BACT|nr:AMIN domain-containing protein [Hydrogenimonas thermophila]SFO92615.1 AMIN domain-containing protein [Hydrogenimonas thermophila]
MRFLTILIALYSLTLARQNPFKPVIDETVLPVTANKIEKVPDFKELRINLPSDARVLKSVTIFYQSIDGSVKKESLKVDKSIDWHKPIIVTQGKLKPTYKSSKKRISKSIYKPLPFISFQLIQKNRIKIITKDKKIRSFHLAAPFKVVFDFKRDASFLTKKVPLNKPPFLRLDIGNHDGYYRVVITLDSSYKYKILRVDDGYIVDVL